MRHFSELEGETRREYTYREGPSTRIISIQQPIALHVTEDGGHVVMAQGGDGSFIQYDLEPGWEKVEVHTLKNSNELTEEERKSIFEALKEDGDEDATDVMGDLDPIPIRPPAPSSPHHPPQFGPGVPYYRQTTEQTTDKEGWRTSSTLPCTDNPRGEVHPDNTCLNFPQCGCQVREREDNKCTCGPMEACSDCPERADCHCAPGYTCPDCRPSPSDAGGDGGPPLG